uniref:Protein-tyrosine phosphatase n=1 Tax=Parascaris univalens TaxID=6257 RepID=A0A915AZX3_PARUN
HANKWVDTTLDKGVDGLKKDFESLKRFVPDPFETTVFETNNTTGRNRYRAPLDGTVNNFYQMILQEGVRAIIMLCNFTESGRKICTEYYPLNEGDAPLVFGDITVVCLHTSDMPGESKVHITWLGLKSKSGKRQTIRHIQWKDWPEHGVPEVSLTPMNILTAVRGSRGPVLVHCIDGVSRTGTIVAIEFILEKMLRGDANDDSSAMIKELRKQRALAIRTAMQYVYIHRELLQYLQERQITEMSQRLLEFVDDYDRFYKQYAKENATPPFTTNNPNEGDDAKTACFGQFNTADYFNVPKSTYLDSKTQISPSDPE